MRKSSAEVTFESFFLWMNWYIGFLNKIFEAQKLIGKLKEKKEHSREYEASGTQRP